MKISVAMIVKNEEVLLGRCLESVKELDEIVILDTGSTDGTAGVAKKYTNLYFEGEYTWNDNFAEARNVAQSKCSGDWILAIDADEFLVAGGIERIREAVKTTKFNSVDFIVKAEDGKTVHRQPRLYRNQKDIFWKGKIHNFLSISEGNRSDIVIIYGYSPAHNKDPNRAFRILKSVVDNNADAVREVFYLAREYTYRRDWIRALYWIEIYVTRGYWAPELAEAWLLKAMCLWYLRRGESARDACLQAIKINANFKEACLLMAEMSGPKNRVRWNQIAATASNEDVLFNRSVAERSAQYYDEIHKTGSVDRYEALMKKAGELVSGSVLDIGCGTAAIQKYIEKYHGFDFSTEAVKQAGNTNVWKGNIYDKENYSGGYDSYLMIEVLEHLEDDCLIFSFIPSDAKVVFSVPSFRDPGHIRVFNEKALRERYQRFIDINKIVRFNWDGKAWAEGGEETPAYILLVEAARSDGI